MPDAPWQMPDDLKGKSVEDLARMYVEQRSQYDNTRQEYDKYKGEWEPRQASWQRYEKLGTPDEIEQLNNWGQTQAAPIMRKIAQGEAYLLNDADYKAYKAWADRTKGGRQQPAETSADDELFKPLEQRLTTQFEQRFNDMLDARARQFQQNLDARLKMQQDQLNLYAHVNDLKAKHPNVNFNDLLKRGAELAQMPADQLFDALLDSEVKGAGMEAEIEKRVAARLAEKQTDAESDRAKALLENRRVGTNFNGQRPTRDAAMRGLVGTLGQKFPDIWNQLPVT